MANPSRARLVPLALPLITFLAAGLTLHADWDHWRGPTRDGRSEATGLPERWSPAGENLAWRAPFGSRSAPIVVGDRVCLQNGSGSGDSVQERVMCLDATTGKPIWEYKVSVYLTDVPAHRVAWASPVADPAAGEIYALTGNGRLLALTLDGKLRWEHSLIEEYGVVTTHGGRMMSPILEGDLVIVSGLNASWGDHARGSNRFFAFDRRSGQLAWVSTPQQRHYDTNDATPLGMTVNGTRLIIAGGTDGVMHALQSQTGVPVWHYEVSKRAINTMAVPYEGRVLVSHSEENLDTNEMGRLTLLDPSATGAITPAQIAWTRVGVQAGYASPVVAGDLLLIADNGAVLRAFDVKTGEPLWDHHLGTIQKSSPVFADGKLYVGTENGGFYIIRPTRAGAQVLDRDQLGTEQEPEAIIGSPAIGHGRIYLPTMEALYAIGPAKPRLDRTAARTGDSIPAAPAGATPARVLVFPAETHVASGQAVQFRARLFDAGGHVLREAPATWKATALPGTIDANGRYTAPAGSPGAAGMVTAVVDGLEGTARVRVLPSLPITENFDGITGDAPPAHWIAAAGRYEVRDLDGSRVLVRPTNNTVVRRTRTFIGSPDLSDYTVEADVRANERRRQRGDVGIIAQRYALVLFGNSNRLELQPWQAAPAMTVSTRFPWQSDTWYRMKLRVENLSDGTTRVQGKVWPRGEPEPAAWTVEKIDRIPHRNGAPGLYSDAGSDLAFDNVSVTANTAAPAGTRTER